MCQQKLASKNKKIVKSVCLFLVSVVFPSIFVQRCFAKYYECEDSAASLEGCPPQLSQLQEVVARLFTILITLVGLVTLFVIVRSGIGIMTSGDNEEKKAKEINRLKIGVLGTVGVFLAYTAIVFIATWLGLSEGPLSFVSGGKIIFRFLLPN